MIAPEILKSYTVPIFPQKSFAHKADASYHGPEENIKFANEADDPDVQGASIQTLETSIEYVPNSRKSSYSRACFPVIPQQREIIMTEKRCDNENPRYGFKSANNFNQKLTPFQIQKQIQEKNLSQWSSKKESKSMPNIYVESPQTKLPISKIISRSNNQAQY
jgi:hypothetical protein